MKEIGQRGQGRIPSDPLPQDPSMVRTKYNCEWKRPKPHHTHPSHIPTVRSHSSWFNLLIFEKLSFAKFTVL